MARKSNLYRKPHVLDGDGVVLDGGSQKTVATLEMFGVHIEPHAFTRANIRSTGLLSMDDYEEMKEVAYNHWVWASRFQFIAGCLPALLRLDRLGVPLAIASRRVQLAASYTERLLWQHGLYNIPVFGAGLLYSKPEVMKHLGGMASYTDDDIECLDVGKSVRDLFLLTQPHNLDHDCQNIGRRLDTWEELFAHICSLENRSWENGLPQPKRRFNKVRAVIVEPDEQHGPRILLSCRNGGSMDGCFEFPGGNIDEADPDSLSATIRETVEEIGELPEPLVPQTFRLVYDPDRKEYTYVYFFLMRGLDSFVKAFTSTDESSGLTLVEPGRWPECMLPTMRKHMGPLVADTVCDLVSRQPRLIR